LLSALVVPALSYAQLPPTDGERERRATASTARKLSRLEFDALLKSPEKVLVLDVRRPDEIQAIGGFPVFLSVQAAALESYMAFIPRDRAIVPVSNHAARAARAAALLEQHGFTVAGVI